MTSLFPSPTPTSAPLQSPFWFTTNDPSCPAIILNSTSSASNDPIFCCAGLLLDTTQPILGPIANQHPFYLQNLRCCSGDPDVALASVTSCTAGSLATLALSTAGGGSSMGQVTASRISSGGVGATVMSGMSSVVGVTATKSSMGLSTSASSAAGPSPTKSDAGARRVQMVWIFAAMAIPWIGVYASI